MHDSNTSYDSERNPQKHDHRKRILFESQSSCLRRSCVRSTRHVCNLPNKSIGAFFPQPAKWLSRNFGNVPNRLKCSLRWLVESHIAGKRILPYFAKVVEYR